MQVDGLIFAGVASRDRAATARFLADVPGVDLEEADDVHRLAFANGTDGRRFELLDRR